MSNETTTTETIHAFEKAGLGKAPFKFAGEVRQDIAYGERVLGSIGGCTVTTKPGGTCAFCGQYIVAMFGIVSADGNRFHVGSDCAAKTGDKGLIVKIRKIVNAAATARRHANADRKIEAARENFPAAFATLSLKPHPSEYRAARGATLADWCEWMLANAGRKGKLEAAAVIEANIV